MVRLNFKKICSRNWNWIGIEFKWIGIELFHSDRNWNWIRIELFNRERNWNSKSELTLALTGGASNHSILNDLATVTCYWKLIFYILFYISLWYSHYLSHYLYYFKCSHQKDFSSVLQSRVAVMVWLFIVRVSVVCYLRCPGNRCIHQGQILWGTTCTLHL